ncbi:DUF4097 family beta strand repeat-containing protein [Streptomyces sp. YKOK-I1]
MKSKAPAAAALTLMALLSGCSSDDVTSDTNSYTVSESVSALKVQSRGGLIEVVASDRTTVEVTETFRYSDGKPETKHTVSGSTLSLTTADCSSGSSPCEVSYRIEVPRELALSLASQGGDVEVSAVSGELTVATDGGSASGEKLASTTAEIRTSGGDVDAAFATAPDAVDAGTDGGDLTLKLPSGSYAVDADAQGGDEKVTVKTDPASSHKVTAKSGGGTVTVTS